MVTLSLTRTRVAAVLRSAAEDLARTGWDPQRAPMLPAIDRAAGWTRPGDLAEDVTLAAWDALGTHLGMPVPAWEQADGRTQADVLAALRGAAEQLMAGAA